MKSPTKPELKRAGVLPTEAQLLRAIRGYLDARGIFHLRLNSGARVVADRDGRRRAIHLCQAGTADLVVFPDGAPALWVEVKGPGGVLSAEQRRFLALRAAAGHAICVARSIVDVAAALRALPPARKAAGGA